MLFFIFFFVGVFTHTSNAQLALTLQNVEVAATGDVASVDVVATSGFTNLFSTQMSFGFDSLQLQFVNVTNFNTTLDLSSSNFSGPNGAGVKNGQVTFSWQDGQNAKTLANGTLLFKLNFKTLGAKCTNSQVQVTGKPLAIEIVDANFNYITLTSTPSTVSVKCDGPADPCQEPACDNPSNFKLIGGVKNAKPGTQVCIPISVKNFTNIENGQGAITWDSTKLKYKSKIVPGVLPKNLIFNEADSLSGKVSYLWYPDDGNAVTLNDDTVIFELCFTVLGAVGESVCVTLGQGVPATLWGSTTVSELPICYEYGQVNIISDDVTTMVQVGTNSGTQGQTVCVDITVKDFTNVVAANASFTWNPAELKYVSTGAYNLAGLKFSDFNLVANNGVPDSKLNFLWQSSMDPVDKNDGDVIFQICFQLLDCPKTATIQVASTEIIGDGAVTLPSAGTPGSITISCGNDPCTITTNSVTDVTCFGMSNGAISVTVNNAATGCMCQWKNSAGTIVKAAQAVTSGCNISGIAAGSYTVEVLCNNVVTCSASITVNQPTAINIPTFGNITNVNCGTKGAIDISGTSGGTKPYTYNWSPNLGNVDKPTNLDAGVYNVTVTDAHGCTSTAALTVGNATTAMTLTGTSTNVKCFGGSDGSIALNINGGCTPYTITWSGGLTGANPQNLKSGTYNVTVVDSATPTHSANATFTISQPQQAVSITVTNVTKADQGVSNGSITLDIVGGTPNYSTNWSAGGNNASNITKTTTASNLGAGTYNVTITDANGCTAIQTGIEITENGTLVVAPTIGTVTASNFNGSGIACNGGSNGTLTVTLSKGTAPFDVRVLSGTTVVKVLQPNTQTFTVSDLKAGTYTVEVKNASGTVTSSAIILSEPTKLVAQSKVECTAKDEDTGSITINMNNTGTAPYSYSWGSSSNTSNTLSNIGQGPYNVTITDANDCVVSVSNIEVEFCNTTGPGCFESTDIVTPNGDNINDYFIISCLDQYQNELTIFDRWGKVVYSAVNYDNSWYGLDLAGKDLPEGSYIWVLTVYKDNGVRDVYKNTMTLLR